MPGQLEVLALPPLKGKQGLWSHGVQSGSQGDRVGASIGGLKAAWFERVSQGLFSTHIFS